MALGAVVRAGDVVALDGELGAGKTRLVRGIAWGMGLDGEQVSSPTFVIINQYERSVNGGAALTPLVHADAYRLSSAEDLESAGWDAAVGSGDAVVCVEWASRVAGALAGAESADVLARVTLAVTGQDSRRLLLDAPPGWALRTEWRGLAGLASGAGLRCPVCGKPVDEGSASAPFDSARCRDADLARWFSGEYAIGRAMREGDEEEV